jgi:hypothetical protein
LLSDLKDYETSVYHCRERGFGREVMSCDRAAAQHDLWVLTAQEFDRIAAELGRNAGMMAPSA